MWQSTRDRAAVLLAVAVGLALVGLLVVGDAGAAAAKRPNLVVPTITDPPASADAGDTFRIRSVVKNLGPAKAGASTVRLYLSRDKVQGSGDLVVAGGRVGALLRGRSVIVDATVRVPKQARGSYHVITCADAARKVRESNERDNCRNSARKVTVTGGLDADLTGKLTFFDVGETASGSSTTTWDRYGEVQVSMHVKGPVGTDFIDTGSTYVYEGEEILDSPGGHCPWRQIRTEAGGGPLTWTGNPFTDDIQGYLIREDLTTMHLGVSTRYHQVTDRASCEGTTTLSGFARLMTSMDLVKVSSTASTITYEVESFEADMGTASPWDRVEGRLTLARNP